MKFWGNSGSLAFIDECWKPWRKWTNINIKWRTVMQRAKLPNSVFLCPLLPFIQPRVLDEPARGRLGMGALSFLLSWSLYILYESWKILWVDITWPLGKQISMWLINSYQHFLMLITYDSDSGSCMKWTFLRCNAYFSLKRLWCHGTEVAVLPS